MPDLGQRNRGGRPRVTDKTAIAAVGLRLFAERGYDAVTMAEIADACDIGRTTLLRYFASKVDIVWDRSDDEVSALTARLQQAPGSADAVSVLCTELPAMLAYDDSEVDLLRTQVRIIGESAEGWPLGSARFAPWESVVARFITERTRHGADGLYTKLLTQSLLSAGWTAMTVWAASDEPRPERLLVDAFTLVRNGFSEQ
ncbi:TetR/AcrR family transcriptional regulator [Williamsia sp. DF01-3]|uniref:TetR/AcrR family transcriptional regulator n=1 Tax=Williamsia sp. DF01-3 TaxID=2934157 RepID=UPI001FF5DC6C|nr:TetR/AcrR family transcriptional regulator [Williamsia sp. DF01-3]MCK0516674.1 TetR/AcrR family transcriptional regulator [Williamsia sp. DF01-3]